jgi:hypothetical protein
MKNEYSALFLVAIVLSMAIVAQIDFVQTADAVKAKGTKSMKYGMATKDKVCGDRLCTPEDFTSTGERKSLPELSDSSVSSHMAMAKMDRLFDLHRMQLVSAWDSMTDSEKSQKLITNLLVVLMDTDAVVLMDTDAVVLMDTDAVVLMDTE